MSDVRLPHIDWSNDGIGYTEDGPIQGAVRAGCGWCDKTIAFRMWTRDDWEADYFVLEDGLLPRRLRHRLGAWYGPPIRDRGTDQRIKPRRPFVVRCWCGRDTLFSAGGATPRNRKLTLEDIDFQGDDAVE
jgi:hypothetical protein